MVSYSGKQFDGFLDKKPCNYHDPAIELLGIYPPEKNKKTKHKIMFTQTLVYEYSQKLYCNSKNPETAQMSFSS